MKKSRRWLFSVLGVLLLLAAPGWQTLASAQTGYSVFHHFTGGTADGGAPHGDFTPSADGSILYGMAYNGGTYGTGTIFQTGIDGSGFTILHNFAPGEGAYPWGSLTLSGATLYGMNYGGGQGAIFSIGTGTPNVFTPLHLFASTDGVNPYGNLVVSSDGYLYGMTSGGGSYGYGTIFKIATGGTGFTVLHSFTNAVTDGTRPYGSLTFSADGTHLYGMTEYGGANGVGTIFTIATDGSGFTVLHSFAVADGTRPLGSLTPSADGAYLYGMTYANGANNIGTIFKIATGGTGFTVLHSFANADGGGPWGTLTLSGSVLYGMTNGGGSSGYGTLFQVGTDGTGFAVLHNFAGSNDGAQPFGSPVLSGSVLYGMTSAGGEYSSGTAFSLHFVTVASTSPAAGAMNVPVTSTVIATFDSAMDATTITTSTFTLNHGATGAVLYDPGTKTATYTPSAGLAHGTTYTATLTTGVKDASGNSLPVNYTWTFTTAPAPVAPTVASTSPVNGATNVPITGTVSATFDTVMDATTITTSTFTVSDTTGAVSYDPATKTATYTPSAGLAYNMTYAATLTTGVQNSAGTPLANYTWTFTSAAAPSSTPPTVTLVTPENGTTNVPVNTIIVATFSEAMAASTINAANFTVSGVSGTVSYSASTYTATFTPSSQLASGATYTASISSAVTDLAGNHLASFLWSFTTGTGADTTSPYVMTVVPANQSTGIPADTVIRAVFSEPVNVTTSSFLVESSGGVPITGTVGVVSNVAVFTPASPIASPYNYTATITTGVEDLAGNHMTADYSWSFTTVDTPAATYSSPPNSASVGSVTDTGNITVSVPSGVTLSAVQAFSDGSPSLNKTNKPAGLLFPDGMVYFEATGVTTPSITVTITFPTAIAADARVYKAGPSGFYDFTSYASISGNTVTLTLTDGGPGDDDGNSTPNGTIIDPVGIGDPISSTPSLLSWNFGSVATGYWVAQPFTMTETSGGLLTIGAITLSGANANQFRITSDTCSGATLSMSSCTYVVAFIPTSAGAKTASISATSSASPLSGALSGTGTASAAAGSGGGGGGNTCFIATAAYGSYLDPHVASLRSFRDRRLLTNAAGRAFVAFYYRHSPPVAGFIGRHGCARMVTRWALTPLVCGVEHPYPLLLALALGMGMMGAGFRRRKGR